MKFPFSILSSHLFSILRIGAHNKDVEDKVSKSDSTCNNAWDIKTKGKGTSKDEEKHATNNAEHEREVGIHNTVDRAPMNLKAEHDNTEKDDVASLE